MENILKNFGPNDSDAKAINDNVKKIFRNIIKILDKNSNKNKIFKI